MTAIATATHERMDELIELVSRRLMVSKNCVLPFVDADDFLPHLLSMCRHSRSRLLVVGHMSPDVAIAADRAELMPEEILGPSPFSGDIDGALARIQRSDLVYIANPNRVTGSNYSLADLELLARKIPEGALIVDEYYFDHFGISAAPLIDRYKNVVILRSFTASFGISSSEAGYCVAAASALEPIREGYFDSAISTTQFRLLTTSLANDDTLEKRIKVLHDEALRIATALTRLGAATRITAADFLLVRVADAKSVGNYLARHKLPIENLDGYPQLDHCLRYRLQSQLSNDLLIDAFTKMPAEFYRMGAIDRHKVTLRRGAETAPRQSEIAAEPSLVYRSRVKIDSPEKVTVES
jgi:histidinol-phosphate/aromatic aminotransferase/cobyric acid decarboxylase-like protein